ncbi:hypothetical protein JCM11641_002563 [Rhodosporidiobolus odoratus]
MPSTVDTASRGEGLDNDFSQLSIVCLHLQHTSTLSLDSAGWSNVYSGPICASFVREVDINLHLDFCSGPSTSTAPAACTPTSQSANFNYTSTPASSQASGKAPSASDGPASKKRKIVNSSNTTVSSPSSSASSSKRPRATPTRASTTFSHLEAAKPLAELVRPRVLEDFVGQEHLIGKGALLRSLIDADKVGSCLFWGPPGTGKTTIARVIAKTTSSVFKEMSATSATTADLRAVFTEAESVLKLTGRKTLLFIDEIQRFNKAQQDAFLPVVEAGILSLIASTTENPSFRVNTALLSRCRVFVLIKLSTDDLVRVLLRALRLLYEDTHDEPLSSAFTSPSASSKSPPNIATTPLRGATLPTSSAPSSSIPEPTASAASLEGSSTTKPDPLASDPILAHTGALDLPLLRFLAAAADGDARVALSSLDLALSAIKATPSGQPLDKEELKQSLRKAHLQYDRNGENHYDTISALHKSVRGSDANAALYWLARMLEGGEDPLYVARRCVRMASEDIGLANPQALPQALAAYQATQLIGMPECDCILAQCVVMLAESPKSVRTYKAYGAAKHLVKETENYPVPLHIRNAPTGLMKSLGYGRDYRYEPGYAHPVYQPFIPPELASKTDFLKDDTSIAGKLVNEAALREWEWKKQGGAKWEGREEMVRKLKELEEMDRVEAEADAVHSSGGKSKVKDEAKV